MPLKGNTRCVELANSQKASDSPAADEQPALVNPDHFYPRNNQRDRLNVVLDIVALGRNTTSMKMLCMRTHGSFTIHRLPLGRLKYGIGLS